MPRPRAEHVLRSREGMLVVECSINERMRSRYSWIRIQSRNARYRRNIKNVIPIGPTFFHVIPFGQIPYLHCWRNALAVRFTYEKWTLLFFFFRSCAQPTGSLPEQIINSENSGVDNSGKVWVHKLFFLATKLCLTKKETQNRRQRSSTTS